MYPSDPLYPVWSQLLTMRAQLINASLFWDLCQIPEAERAAELARLDAEVGERWGELAR